MREDVKQPDPKSSTRQITSPNKLVIQRRAPGTLQNETSAAVYLLHLPDPSFCASSGAHAGVCAAELRAHFNLLCANEKVTLILIADVLPEPGTPDAAVEAVARLQDLLLFQMGHEEAFEMTRLMGLLEGVCDDKARLTVVNQLSSPDHPVVAFELRARPLSN
jgi:hypothetical protein